MQAILLVTVFSCLLAAANVAAAALGDDCTDTDTCTDAHTECSSTSVCECSTGYTDYSGSCAITHGTVGGACLSSSPACTGDTLVCESNVCKKKAGQACSATAECVSLSTCSTTCTCNNGYSAAATGLCTAIAQGKVNAVCDGTKLCTGSNVECTGGFCTCKAGSSGNKGDDDCTITPGTVGGACLATGSACTGDTLVCETTVCKKKGGQTCSATTECVSLSTCSTTCTCNDGYNTGSTGTCAAIAEGKVNAVCDETRNCTGVNDACTDGFCKCKTGFSGNKGDADCSGVAPQYVSSWLLTISIIMCLVTLSLP